MSKSTLTIGAFLLVVLGAWALTSSARNPSAARVERGPLPAASAGPESDPRDREIAELKTRLAAIEAAQRVSDKRAAAKTDESPAAAKGSADGRDPAIVKREAEIAAWMEHHYTPEVQANVFGMYFADVDRVRLAETTDEAFGSAVISGLSELLQNAKSNLGETKLLDVACGSTLCRIKLDVGRPSERGRLVHAIQQTLKLEEASVYMPSSGTLLEGYFARAGTSLPQFDQIRYVGAEMNRVGDGDDTSL